MNITINGQSKKCPFPATILDVAKETGINIPTLCYLKEVNEIGECNVCVAEANGELVTACTYKVTDGMKILTNTQRVRDARRHALEKIMSAHRGNCLNCVRNLKCELQTLSAEFSIKDLAPAQDYQQPQVNCKTKSLTHDNSKCIKCRRCTAVCEQTQGIAISDESINLPCNSNACVNCGQCVIACPTAALTETSDTAKVYAALADKSKYVVAITAPAVRVALGECFGSDFGTNVEGKMVAALRALGFAKVFDVPVGADFTIMEESAEFINRLQTGENLPLFTSCCSSWVSYCEEFYPEFVQNLSSCKSPQMMLGSLLKAYYAQKIGIAPKDLYVVSVMPCIAKKEEIRHPHSQAVSGINDIDVVITTRELAGMIKAHGISFNNLPGEKFDPALGISTGAGYIFGTSGGVMEAALRTVVETVTGESLGRLQLTELRGMQGIKEAEYNLGGRKVRVAVVSGLKNAGQLLDSIKSGAKKYDMVEVMASPGGCIGGGGQPIHSGLRDVSALRSTALYHGATDSRPVHKSHESPIVKELYANVIGEPGGETAHRWLHTTYRVKSI